MEIPVYFVRLLIAEFHKRRSTEVDHDEEV